MRFFIGQKGNARLTPKRSNIICKKIARVLIVMEEKIPRKIEKEKEKRQANIFQLFNIVKL